MGSRNYGVDILKVCAMFMVVNLHVLGQGGILKSCESMSLNYEVAWFVEIASYCAVNCFAIATGYLMIDKEFKYRRIIPLWLQVAFYTIGITVMVMVLNPQVIGIRSFIKAIMPVTFAQYWYFTAYVGGFLFMPIINLVFRNFNQKVVLKTIVILCSVSTIASIANANVFNLANGYSTLWLIVMYMIGGYIKIWRSTKTRSKNIYLLGYVISIVITWLSQLVISYLSILIFGEVKYSNILISYISPTILLAGIFLFLYFQQVEVHNLRLRKIVSGLSKVTFGIYIIHVNPYVFSYGAGKFALLSEKNTLVLVGGVLISSLCIFTICAAIEWCRMKLFEMLDINKRVEHGVISRIEYILIQVSKYSGKK